MIYIIKNKYNITKFDSVNKLSCMKSFIAKNLEVRLHQTFASEIYKCDVNCSFFVLVCSIHVLDIQRSKYNSINPFRRYTSSKLE